MKCTIDQGKKETKIWLLSSSELMGKGCLKEYGVLSDKKVIHVQGLAIFIQKYFVLDDETHTIVKHYKLS